MEIKMLALELEQWARERGWKTVTRLITSHHGDDLLESLEAIAAADEFARRLHNNTQILQRAFRTNTPHYRRQAERLSHAVRAAIDAEQKKRQEAHQLVAVANRECIEATSAALLCKPPEVIRRETIEAIESLTAVLDAFSHSEHRAA
ncbi:toxin YdaT family protein [Serratia rhizosphaerae]